MKVIIVVCAIFFLALSTTATACLTESEKLLIQDMSEKTNVSEVQLTDMFTRMCNKYTIQETDIYFNLTEKYMKERLGALDNLTGVIETDVGMFLLNYTSWFETRIEMVSVLQDISRIINASESVQNYDNVINTRIDSRLDIIKKQLSDMQRDKVDHSDLAIVIENEREEAGQWSWIPYVVVIGMVLWFFATKTGKVPTLDRVIKHKSTPGRVTQLRSDPVERVTRKEHERMKAPIKPRQEEPPTPQRLPEPEDVPLPPEFSKPEPLLGNVNEPTGKDNYKAKPSGKKADPK